MNDFWCKACNGTGPAGPSEDLVAATPDDLRTHRASWRRALELALAMAAPSGADHDDAVYWDHEIAAFDRAFAATPAVGGEAPLPTYGNLPWDQLGRDVMEANMGTRCDFEFDPKFYPGHQSLSTNFNSLARIVDKYRVAAPPASPLMALIPRLLERADSYIRDNGRDDAYSCNLINDLASILRRVSESPPEQPAAPLDRMNKAVDSEEGDMS